MAPPGGPACGRGGVDVGLAAPPEEAERCSSLAEGALGGLAEAPIEEGGQAGRQAGQAASGWVTQSLN